MDYRYLGSIYYRSRSTLLFTFVFIVYINENIYIKNSLSLSYREFTCTFVLIPFYSDVNFVKVLHLKVSDVSFKPENKPVVIHDENNIINTGRGYN